MTGRTRASTSTPPQSGEKPKAAPRKRPAVKPKATPVKAKAAPARKPAPAPKAPAKATTRKPAAKAPAKAPARSPRTKVGPDGRKPAPLSKSKKAAPGELARSKTEIALERAANAAKAARLRAQRYGWEHIAQECGYASRGAAYTAVQNELKKIPREAVEELRLVELESLDQAEAALQKRLAKGDTYAVDSMLRIKAQRAKLTGLYEQAPETGLGEVKDALRGFLAGARAAVAVVDPKPEQEPQA